jgi:hypothetical protein
LLLSLALGNLHALTTLHKASAAMVLAVLRMDSNIQHEAVEAPACQIGIEKGKNSTGISPGCVDHDFTSKYGMYTGPYSSLTYAG